MPILLAALLALALPATPPQTSREDDLAAARALFERNIAAIQQRDREAYLACYLPEARLVRTDPAGSRLGFDGLAAGTPPTGDDAWPDELVARDLRLHWLADGLVYGTYHYQVRTGGDLSRGLSERLFRRTEDGWRIAVSTAFAAPPGTPPAPLLLRGATLHRGDGAPPLHDAAVLLRDGRIESLGPAGDGPAPDDVEVLDLHGAFLVPGLIDAHVHYSQTGWADGRPDARDVGDRHPYPQAMADLARHPERLHRAFLAHGVTAVFDVGGYPWTRALAAAAEDDPLAPHVVAAGPLLATWTPEEAQLPDQQQLVLMRDEQQVRDVVAAHAAAGSGAIKVWYIVAEEGDREGARPLVMAAGDAARAAGLPLVVHATELETARIAVEAGARLLVHSVEDELVDDAFVAALLERDVAYCPTLLPRRGYVHLFRGELPAQVAAQLARVHPSVAARVRQTEGLGPDPRLPEPALERMLTAQQRREATMAANLLRLHRAGVRIAAGTDAGNPLTLHGASLLPELLAMQAAGMSPLAVLTAATSDAARALGRGDDLGLLAPGRPADLLVLDADPAADVAALGALRYVVRGGVLHTPESLLPR